MMRQNLSGMTLEEREAHRREQANERKRKQREKQKKEREMTKKLSVLTPNSPEVVEFVDALRGLKFSAMIEPIAMWEREYKQRLPIDSSVTALFGESNEDYQKRRYEHTQLCLARFYSLDFYGRQKAVVRRKAFDDRESAESVRFGITVYQLRNRKKIAAWKANKIASQNARELERLARRLPLEHG